MGGEALAGAILAAIAVMVELAHPMRLYEPRVRAAIETTVTISAVITAALLLVRFDDKRQRGDLMLIGALAAVSLSDLAFSAIPAVTGYGAALSGTGANLGSEMLVAIAFAAVAFAPRTRVEGSSRRPVTLAALAGVATVALGELIGLPAGGGSASIAPHASGLAAAALSLAVAVASSVTLLAAGIRFAWHGAGDDREAGLLAAAAFVLAAARLQYLAIPTIGGGWVTPRDGARLVAYALLLAVAVRKSAKARRSATRAAVTAERQRIARELHDGLAQDLAFIVAYSDRLASELGAEHQLTIAARRAFAASRGVMVDLAASTAPTTLDALRSVANELASRFDVHVEVRSDPDRVTGCGAELDPRDREHVVRIAREAIVNAIRHGHARHIMVELGSRGSEHLLRVSDDGQGIESPETRTSDGTAGFGIPGMRARAKSVGGTLVAGAGPGGGTAVEVLTS